MTFDAQERAALAALADVLIPAGSGFPAASDAGVAAQGLDEVWLFRPDLAVGLKKILASTGARPASDVVADMKANDPSSFDVLTEAVAGAYFLNSQVRARLGYDGQQPRPINVRSDDLDPALLQPVIQRGPIYRPTPDADRR
jgi:hypothetical protein